LAGHPFPSGVAETLPNRAFVGTATSQGHLDDTTKIFTSGSIFAALTRASISWAIYGYNQPPLTRHTFPDITNASDSNFGQFQDFQRAARDGTLASFVFLEPSWGESGNSQHPVGNVAAGEQLIHDVYYALFKGPKWSKTLLIVTYDEHGGIHDHVLPPWTAAPPDGSIGEFGFEFNRFCVRVPAVFVSPLIESGTILRAPFGKPPFDHTSILKTVETRWDLQPLSKRDAAAADISAVLTLPAPRGDDPLQGVIVPAVSASGPASGPPTKLQKAFAELISRLPVPDGASGIHHELPNLRTSQDYDSYINQRSALWQLARRT
jgi:phospholipase C